MTAEEIRAMKISPNSDSRNELLREIAAQLAELNDHLRFVSYQDKKDERTAAIRVKVFG